MLKPIPDFPNYFASDEGHIYSMKKSGLKRLKPIIWKKNPYGRMRVGLSRKGKVYSRLVYQLILEAFIGKCPPGMETCHYNGNHIDNRLSNLRWDSRMNNVNDAKRQGKIVRGEHNGGSKLKEADVFEIRDLLLSGTAHRTIGKMYNVDGMTIGRISRKQSWSWL